jgi:hypothetical protein
MNEDELERRLRDAVAAETEPVRVDEEAALDAIRQRAASGRRRRLVGATALGAAAALLIGIAIGAAVGRDDDGHANVASGGPSTTIGADCASTTTSAPSTSAPSRTIVEDNGTTLLVPPTAIAEETVVEQACQDTVPDTTGPSSSTDTTAPPVTTIPGPPPVVFPTNGFTVPGHGYDDPATTAGAFLESIGADHPGLGAFQQTGPETGTIAVHPVDGNGQVRTDITRSVLHMVRFSGHWAVQRATSESIVIDEATVQPPADAKGDWTLAVSGSGRGFEAMLHLQAIGHGDVAFAKTTTAMASGDMDLRPFTAFIDLGTTPPEVLTLVVANEGGDTGGPADLAAVVVQRP